jgi:hypothetical protein
MTMVSTDSGNNIEKFQIIARKPVPAWFPMVVTVVTREDWVTIFLISRNTAF